MTVGILGLQGAIQEHIPHLTRCGERHRVVRDKNGLQQISRLIIPGGESTVMLKFLCAFDMLALLRERIVAGLPVWGICAGAIVLAETIDESVGPIGALPVALRRNAYGRQIASRQHRLDIPVLGKCPYPAIFIRAPRIVGVREEVQVHAILKGGLSEAADPVFVQYGRLMATTFHPELNQDDLFYRYFLAL